MVATGKNGALQSCLSDELIQVFKLLEQYVDPLKNKATFEAVDEELARRVGEKTLENE